MHRYGIYLVYMARGGLLHPSSTQKCQYPQRQRPLVTQQQSSVVVIAAVLAAKRTLFRFFGAL